MYVFIIPDATHHPAGGEPGDPQGGDRPMPAGRHRGHLGRPPMLEGEPVQTRPVHHQRRHGRTQHPLPHVRGAAQEDTVCTLLIL